MSKLDFIKQLFSGGNADEGLPKPLITALDRCAQAPKLLDEEMKRLNEFYAELQAEGRGEDELEQVQFQMDLMRWQLTAAHEEGKRRREYINSLDTPEKREEEIARCSDGKEGLIHWINHWAWTHDPRPDAPISTMPFRLFDFQDEYERWLYDLVYKYRSSGLTDKSRDMGVTWSVVDFVVHQWRFAHRFDALVGSKTEDFVDKKGREDTLMEKMRFVIRMLPFWMHPEGFDLDKHMPYLNILNPATGSFIAGESANDNFGRQGRYSFLWIDEFPIFPEGGYAAWTACSQSSRTKLVVGTPKGRLNKFADLRWKSKIRTKSFHWKSHPWKDDRWYRAESATMNDAEKAQELDIDYDASQVGLVFKNWDPLYHVITQSEFAAFYKEEARWVEVVEDGMIKHKLLPPAGWMFACAQDWGSTVDHRCVTTYAMTPRAASKLSDSVFLWHEYVSPIGDAPKLVGDAIIELEKEWGIWESYLMHQRLNSHEAKSERDTYELQNLDFEPWETDFTAGIAQLRNYMLLRDKDKPHPFRPNLPIKGRPRFYIIVDDKYAPQWDKSTQKWFIPDPETGDSFSRARVEIQLYHIPASEAGKPVRQQRPMKAVDDAMDTWRSLAAQFFPPIASLTDEEYVESKLPPNLRKSEIAKLTPEEMSMMWLTRQMEISEIEVPVDKHWRKAIYSKKAKYN